jgi:hypothetical protein
MLELISLSLSIWLSDCSQAYVIALARRKKKEKKIKCFVSSLFLSTKYYSLVLFPALKKKKTSTDVKKTDDELNCVSL